MTMDVEYASPPRESVEEADKRLKRPGGVLEMEKTTIEMMRQVRHELNISMQATYSHYKCKPTETFVIYLYIQMGYKIFSRITY